MSNSPSPTVLTVSQLNGSVRELLEFNYGRIWLRGEISNLSAPSSGHLYFTLKDDGAQVRAAMFKGARVAARLQQPPQNGQQVLVRARVSLYAPRGDYQLIVDHLEDAGRGALQQAFEMLKARLAAEGLFSAERKAALPAHPRRIGIVSSPTGAVIRDIISVFRRRAPQVELNLVPTAVQGREATAQIVRALQRADTQGFDALILARGGGSLEDLWCFNEEAVARAVAACVTPIVSAVGHETDVSIADFVADVRAPTPSAAAELLAPSSADLQQRLNGLQQRLVLRMRDRLHRDAMRLDGLTRRLRHPGERLQQQAQRIDDLEQRLLRALDRRLCSGQERLARLETRLAAQHPGRTLNLLRQRLDSVQRQRALKPDMSQSELSALLGSAYVDSLGTLRFRVQIRGNAQQLQAPGMAERIRAVLLAGVRAAWLWHRLGGRRWHLVFTRGQILQEIRAIAKSV